MTTARQKNIQPFRGNSGLTAIASALLISGVGITLLATQNQRLMNALTETRKSTVEGVLEQNNTTVMGYAANIINEDYVGSHCQEKRLIASAKNPNPTGWPKKLLDALGTTDGVMKMQRCDVRSVAPAALHNEQGATKEDGSFGLGSCADKIDTKLKIVRSGNCDYSEEGDAWIELEVESSMPDKKGGKQITRSLRGRLNLLATNAPLSPTGSFVYEYKTPAIGINIEDLKPEKSDFDYNDAVICLRNNDISRQFYVYQMSGQKKPMIYSISNGAVVSPDVWSGGASCHHEVTIRITRWLSSAVEEWTMDSHKGLKSIQPANKPIVVNFGDRLDVLLKQTTNYSECIAETELGDDDHVKLRVAETNPYKDPCNTCKDPCPGDAKKYYGQSK